MCAMSEKVGVSTPPCDGQRGNPEGGSRTATIVCRVNPMASLNVSPIILVVDCSESMGWLLDSSGEVMSAEAALADPRPRPIEEVEDWIPRLIETMAEIPETYETAALSVIAFNQEATVKRNLSMLRTGDTMFQFEASGTTSFAAALRAVASQLDNYLPSLSSSGFRPAVFWISDGKPEPETEDVWLAERSKLLARPFWPRIIPFAFGNCDLGTLQKLTNEPELMQGDNDPTRDSLQELFKLIFHTIKMYAAGEMGNLRNYSPPQVIEYPAYADS